MHVNRTRDGILIHDGTHSRTIQVDWDALINREICRPIEVTIRKPAPLA